MNKFLLFTLLVTCIAMPSLHAAHIGRVNNRISIKQPGNLAKHYALDRKRSPLPSYNIELFNEAQSALSIHQNFERIAEGVTITMTLMAHEDVWFNVGMEIETGIAFDDALFYMPGFWYRHNERSPKGAPSLRESQYWLVREDRLSTPLTLIYNPKLGKAISVVRTDEATCDALAPHQQGEVMLSGNTSMGYTGFINQQGVAALSFGFPYREAPKTYLRKLTLAPQVEAYQFLAKGDSLTVKWEVITRDANDFAQCVADTWNYSYDKLQPQPLASSHSPERMKQVLSNFYTEGYVSNYPLKYYSGVELDIADCKATGVAEVGFVGRTLLNAFNALEYGEKQSQAKLVSEARAIFDSYEKEGFTPSGLFRELVDFRRNSETDLYSIRRQSEALCAVLYYLDYEKMNGRNHPEWEQRVKRLLEAFVKLQQADGSFPRKFKTDFSVVDQTGGSTPSATLPLVMGYKYFKDKRYLASAKLTMEYLERELIAKSDYFSSTLDANCEDKEASLYASTAAYYLALATKGKERAHYAALCKQSAYFALSWYYLWDVPFAKGQMLGELGLKTRGWGNVSVENNHIDVFIFDFADVLNWLAAKYNEARFARFSEVISSSMRQLLPYEGHLCGVAKVGFYPEVVQHTHWDYGRNGKGFYTKIFAPGWTVASLWELLTPGRIEQFLK